MVEPGGKPKTGPIPHLETFCKAAELASFTQAADALGLTQAAVSQHVRFLEKELGVPLFHRRAGRVELADAGRLLYDHARRILDLHDEARAALGLATPGPSGEVRLAASTIPAECLLPELLGASGPLTPASGSSPRWETASPPWRLWSGATCRSPWSAARSSPTGPSPGHSPPTA